MLLNAYLIFSVAFLVSLENTLISKCSFSIIQISASAESGDLSDSMTYPYFFRTISSISASKSTFVALAKKFKWKRISILFYSRDMYITVRLINTVTKLTHRYIDYREITELALFPSF